MVPLKSVKPVVGRSWSPYAVDVARLSDLEPGVDPGLDTICDGILHRREFIYTAEQLRAVRC